MGLWDKLRGELVDIIEWLDDSRDTIVWRFPRYNNEIKMGAKLVVRESQVAVFVNEGTLADLFPPGTHTLETQNMPILSTLKGWKYGFNSPFKAEVYFVNTRQFTDMKWGTQNPVIVRDPEFGMARLRAFGTFAARVVDPAALLRELVGTDPQFRTEEVQDYLRQMIVSRLGSALANAGVPLLDLATRQAEIGSQLAQVLSQDLESIGIRFRPSSSRTSRSHRRWSRHSTNVPRWESSATSTSTPNSKRPTRWSRPLVPPAVGSVKDSASAWGSRPASGWPPVWGRPLHQRPRHHRRHRLPLPRSPRHHFPFRTSGSLGSGDSSSDPTTPRG